MQFLTPEFFQTNRRKLRALYSDTALIVVTANGLLQRNADTAFPFKQDSSFYYLTGITEPDVVLVMDASEEYLIVRLREGSRAAFDGSVDVELLREISKIDTVLDEAEGWNRLGKRIRKLRKLVTLPPPDAYIKHYGMYTNPARASLISRIYELNPGIELLDARKRMAELRMVKAPEELSAIKHAIQVTETALLQIKDNLKTYEFEYQLEAALTEKFRHEGYVHGYSPIVAAGKNACVLHYIANTDRISKKDLLLIDVGAEVEGYSADITRTYSLGRPTQRQSSVHEAVLAVHEHALSLLKPGVLMKEYEQAIERFMGEQLRKLGLIKHIERETVRQYYPHATSHFLGLDVHDAADYDQPLEPGNVLTVEPGIYIPSEGIGIRVEDDILITDDGAEVLSARLPRDLS